MIQQNDKSTALDTTLFTDSADFKKAAMYLEDLFKTENLIKNKSTKRRKHIQLVLANLLDAFNKKQRGDIMPCKELADH